VRTFIAIELEPTVRRPLLKLLRDELPAAREVKWVTEVQLHITLKFLGEVRDAQLADVCAVATAVSRQVAPFRIRVHGLGCFPGPRNPRVLWTGVTDTTSGCEQWVKLAEPRFAALGFPPEGRAYTPHITLGRARSTEGGYVLQDTLRNARPPETDEMPVREVVIFESRLTSRGAEYRAMARAPLGAEAAS
jgi:2'-5' RNA ligase